MNHSFDIDIAKEYGIEEAIMLQNLYYWIEKNRANNKHFYNDAYWTYNSKKAFAELFPYMTPRKIDYTLNNLISKGLIITGNFNEDGRDRTLWYSITKKGYCILQKCEMQNTKLSDVYINNNTNNNINTTNINITNINNKEKKKTNPELIYDYYLDRSIELKFIQRRTLPNETTINNIRRYLSEYSMEVVKQTIERYFTVVLDKDYFFKTIWNAEKFFKQQNAFKDFLEDGNKWLNYTKWKNNSKPQYNNSKTVEKKELSDFEKNWFKEQDEKFWGKKQ